MEIKSGQKSLSERKFFPGYILVNMILNDETWHMVKNIDKVTGFVGGSALKAILLLVNRRLTLF